jgi:hypothetical protein
MNPNAPRSLVISLLLVLGVQLPAQYPTAHPQDSLQNSPAPVTPFGDFFGSSAEARTQILVPRNELPAGPAQLVGLEVRGLVNMPMVYSLLQIDVAETTATQLQTTFANNLPTTPTTALQATGLTVAFDPTAWTTIGFTTPHAYSGAASLVIDIRKIIGPGSSLLQATFEPPAPARQDRPSMLMTSDVLGSGAANAVAATSGPQNAIALRLLWSNNPTLRNRSDATTGSGSAYPLGGQVEFTAQYTPGCPWTLAIASGFLATPVTLPGFLGEFRLDNAVLIGSSLLDAQGLGIGTIPLPNSPAFVGLYYAYQGLILDVATGALVLTNGTDHFINT